MDKYRKILREYWGYDDFRGIQADIIRSIGEGHDTLGLMPTGGGKSIAFQVPALARDGMCLVVSPLIALMKDQVEHLCQRGIRAAAIYSGMSREEIARHLDNAVFGAYKFLYVSPERLTTDIFRAKVRRMPVTLLAIDEAHCISQWGYDFRPPYLEIAKIRQFMPEVPVLALTATATPAVADDIMLRLAFREKRVFRMSFSRHNLRYIVLQTTDKFSALLSILNHIPGSSIAYTRNREDTVEFAKQLNQQGISALHFHALVGSADKDARQRAWQSGDTRVMVATNAFGMGIDKPDVRTVVHMNVPDSVEAYFQEAGRAGRDGQPAWCVLLVSPTDAANLSRRLASSFPDRAYIKRVYQDLSNFFQVAEGAGEGHTYTIDLFRFCKVFHHFDIQLRSAFSLLEQSGYIHFTEGIEEDPRIRFLCRRDDLYHYNDLSPQEEAALNGLLRNYGGLFADYEYVDYSVVARDSSLSRDQLQEALRTLGRRRIISYIPPRDMPRITYLLPRLDAERIIIPKRVYETRRDSYAHRVNSMIHYVTQKNICRARTLLHYFADEDDDCGHCDICMAQAGTPPTTDEVEELVQRYLHILADGRPHAERELVHTDFSSRVHHAALKHMVQSRSVRRGDNTYVLDKAESVPAETDIQDPSQGKTVR